MATATTHRAVPFPLVQAPHLTTQQGGRPSGRSPLFSGCPSPSHPGYAPPDDPQGQGPPPLRSGLRCGPPDRRRPIPRSSEGQARKGARAYPLDTAKRLCYKGEGASSPDRSGAGDLSQSTRPTATRRAGEKMTRTEERPPTPLTEHLTHYHHHHAPAGTPALAPSPDVTAPRSRTPPPPAGRRSPVPCRPELLLLLLRSLRLRRLPRRPAPARLQTVPPHPPHARAPDPLPRAPHPLVVLGLLRV